MNVAQRYMKTSYWCDWFKNVIPGQKWDGLLDAETGSVSERSVSVSNEMCYCCDEWWRCGVESEDEADLSLMSSHFSDLFSFSLHLLHQVLYLSFQILPQSVRTTRLDLLPQLLVLAFTHTHTHNTVTSMHICTEIFKLICINTPETKSWTL